MVELHWWYDDERYMAIVTQDTLRLLYELLTSFGGVPDTYTYIFCQVNGEKFEIQTMLAMMDHWL